MPSFQATRLALTYPRCDKEVQVALDEVLKQLDVLYAVVSREKHQDGTNHLHAAIVLKKRRSVSHAMLDKIGGKHGDYECMKHEYEWVSYVAKDGDYVAHGIDVKAWLEARGQKQSGRATLVAHMAKDGFTLEEIDCQHSSFVLQNKKKVEEYIAWQGLLKLKTQLMPWYGVDHNVMYPPDIQPVVKWLDANIKQHRDFKEAQLWLYGGVGIGKSTMVEELRKYLRVYDLPLEDFYDSYEETNWIE